MFELALHLRDEPMPEPFPIQEIDPEVELDATNAVLITACELIEEAGAARFVLRCGSDAAWPAQILGELSMILEELVPVLNALHSGAPTFKFELWEQGVQAALEFRREGETLTVYATDLFDGRPCRFGSEPERLPARVLVDQLAVLVEAFLAAVRKACPALTDEDALKLWLRDVRRLIADLRHALPPAQ